MKMTFAHLLGFPALLVSIFVWGQTDDGETEAGFFHHLPLLVNGAGFQSTLLVTNVADQANRCNLALLTDGLSSSSFEVHQSLTWSGSSATLDLPDSRARVSILGRNLSPPEVYGSATLDCDLPVVARVLVTLSSVSLSLESTVAAAFLPSAQEGAVFKFPVLPKMGGYLLAVRNGQGDDASCRVELANESGGIEDEQPLSIAGNASVFRDLTELVQAPADFEGGSATVSCDGQIAATGMLAGTALSGLPPVVLSNDPQSPQTGGGNGGSGDDAGVVTIPDVNLKAAISAALGKVSNTPITRADMRMLTTLSANYSGIRNLAGLETADNLHTLWLGDNNITDISPLAGLTELIQLNLQSNEISNISALSALTGLEYIKLGYNSGSLFGDEDSSGGIEDISPLSNLTNLRTLELQYNKIEDISPLTGLVNLTYLNLSVNNFADLSALSGLTNLTHLLLLDLGIADVSALSSLYSLGGLLLYENDISDISPLAGLTNLRFLGLNYNKIEDISSLAGLTNLTMLHLNQNNITDISALAGLNMLEILDLRGNLLNDSSTSAHIATLEGFGTTIRYNALVKGDYDIELIFTDDFSERQQRVLTYVARHWMAVIADDVPDYEFAQGWSGNCGDASYEIPTGERIDDLRIYMSTHDHRRAVGYGGPSVLRQDSYLPVLGCMSFNLDFANLMITGLHEIGHVLGFGTVWQELDLIQELDGDTHFSGPLAIAAFDEAGGVNFSGAKVPVKKMDGAHWRVPELRGELMGPSGGDFLSAITVQSLADLGYGVDVAQADDFSLPTSISTEAVRSMDLRTSAPLIELGPPHNEIQHFSGDVNPGQNPIHVVDRQGRIVRVIESHVAGHPSRRMTMGHPLRILQNQLNPTRSNACSTHYTGSIAVTSPGREIQENRITGPALRRVTGDQ